MENLVTQISSDMNNQCKVIFEEQNIGESNYMSSSKYNKDIIDLKYITNLLMERIERLD